MANTKIEMLHQMAENMNRFMENQTRIMNSLVFQVKELQNRVASFEMSQVNFGIPRDEVANRETVPGLPRTAMEGNKDSIDFTALRGSSAEAGAPPVAPRRRHMASRSRKEESPRSMKRPTKFSGDRCAPLRTRRPVPLPRRINSSRQTEAGSAPSPPIKARLCETHIMDEPLYPLSFSAPVITPTRVKVSLQESPRTLTSAGSTTSRLPPFSGSAVSLRPSLSWRQHRWRISPRQEGPGDCRIQRTMERGVRGRIRCFIAGRGFGFVTRSDNGGNIFLHRNELLNISRNSAITLQEGDEVLFDVLGTSRTPTARNARLVPARTLKTA